MDYYLTRFFLQKGLACIYGIGFAICLFQGKALIGERGILPARRFIERTSFFRRPSLFFLGCSDFFLQSMAIVGLVLAGIALLGLSEQYGIFFSMLIWFLLWAIYQSFVNIGQVFYGYGWEILLLETGFLAIFLGSADVEPSWLVIWLYRWVLFRVMWGAGLIKLRGDVCWKNGKAMLYHYETQPQPGPLSVYFHRLPTVIHKLSVIFTHFVELVVPVFLLFPGYIGMLAGSFTLFFQVLLMLSGNLSWLNYITATLCFSCFSDKILSAASPFLSLRKGEIYVGYQLVTLVLAIYIAYLSRKPIRNMLSSRQRMNCTFDPLALVNSYGAFGSVTRVRREIILEGTTEEKITPDTFWVAYEFKAKPGALDRRPRQISPYHYKLDWQMWFAAMTGTAQEEWFFRFIRKLLEGDRYVGALLQYNPFAQQPPTFIRADLYEYHFAPKGAAKGVYWTRKKVGSYLVPTYLTRH